MRDVGEPLKAPKVTFLHYLDGQGDPPGQSTELQDLAGMCGCCTDEPITEIQPGWSIYHTDA